MSPIAGKMAHQNCTCPTCCPGIWEVNAQVYGGLYDPSLGCLVHEKLIDYSYEINNPSKGEIAVDAAYERNNKCP